MIEKRVIRAEAVRDNLLSSLESRDVALWIRQLPRGELVATSLVPFLGLPWRLVLSEVYDSTTFQTLEAAASFRDPMTRKRGFVQVIDTDPSRIELPQRCLPIYLLSGRRSGESSHDFESQLRRMTMLESLRRSGAREILVFSDDAGPVPPELASLWSSGFRASLTFVSTSPEAEGELQDWLSGAPDVAAATLVKAPLSAVVVDILTRYSATYPESRRTLRIRDHEGTLHKLDVSEIDDPERPILERYSLLDERDLSFLTPAELPEEDFVGFFRNPVESWRPFAAGLPWIRSTSCRDKLHGLLKRLDAAGPEENCVAFIAAEPGAGGTTLARALAWECAREGYPVLLARPVPFTPEALPLANFFTRVNALIAQERPAPSASAENEGACRDQAGSSSESSRLYETPWIVVFDTIHWQFRDAELVQFRNELVRSGRPVCILTVTSAMLGLSFLNTSIFKNVAELNHSLEQTEARALGKHLNQFLRNYAKERQEWEWDAFYEEHTVRYLDGIAAFWVTLSFWIQGQYDLTESIQHWLYRNFRTHVTERTLQDAILEIAALSTERLPLPEALLPRSENQWPVAHRLEDLRKSLGPLGLVRVSDDGEKYWALVHDVLGRFLINAVFYDAPVRSELGFSEALDAEHLRFLLLRRISKKPLLGERSFRALGEDFATSLFKVDPDHGRGSFASYWREVLAALDGMPRGLRDTSRVFRHHTAVSRRRISKLDRQYYGVALEDQISLLRAAIEDIDYALTFIAYAPGSEPNLNLLNSLANAYFDLAEAESEAGATDERIVELRSLANEATRKAYEESPTNSFVIETYVKNLLQNATTDSSRAVADCIEALGLLFTALASNAVAYREARLNGLADQALSLLLRHRPAVLSESEPTTALDVLIRAWSVLAAGSVDGGHVALTELSAPTRASALAILGHAAATGNMQAVRLRYDLLALDQPFDFAQQLALVEELQASDYRMTPQLSLEYAILLFERGRAAEGDRVFRMLRNLWRESEHFVVVPERLRWLRVQEGRALQVVSATSGSDYGTRAMARVREFGNALVPYRPEEHSIRNPRPGMQFSCHVSFGHNGPFLRPVTAHPIGDA
ncbi:MAG: hypothetical protein K8J08_22425 [Thermoanaerobaculia bacterium]|nr:hypothetical protein [Thermoanaerobaculia bacterium]